MWIKSIILFSALCLFCVDGQLTKRGTSSEDISALGTNLMDILDTLPLAKLVNSKESRARLKKIITNFALVAGPMGAVFGVAGVFFSKGNSPELDAILNLGKEMNNRFDQLDRRMDDLVNGIGAQLGDLSSHITLVNLLTTFNSRADNLKLRKDKWMKLMTNTSTCWSCDQTDMKSYCSQLNGYPTDIATLLAADIDRSRNQAGRNYLVDFVIKAKFNRELSWKIRDRIEAAFVEAYLLIPACVDARYDVSEGKGKINENDVGRSYIEHDNYGIVADKLARIADDQQIVQTLFESTMNSVNNDISAAFEDNGYRFKFLAKTIKSDLNGERYECCVNYGFLWADYSCEITFTMEMAYYTEDGTRDYMVELCQNIFNHSMGMFMSLWTTDYVMLKLILPGGLTAKVDFKLFAVFLDRCTVIKKFLLFRYRSSLYLRKTTEDITYDSNYEFYKLIWKNNIKISAT